MTEREYYLFFSLVSGIGPKTFLSLLSYFKSAEKIWNSDSNELQKAGLFERLIKILEKAKREINIEDYQAKLKQKKASFVAMCDTEYPALLKQIPNPPIVLYVKGDVEALRSQFSDGTRGPVTNFPPPASAPSSEASFDEVRAVGSPSIRATPQTIGIVGTRKITSYGREVTEMFARDLVQNGFTVVSGLAMGVDAVAAWSAIDSGGKTIAVLGNGVDLCFPSSNEQLYDKILESGGLIISEFPLGQSPTMGSFPSRNRIIAGLSLGVLVTEGAEDSGSLITADYAFKFNRKVFAIPGPITSQLSKAPLKLIEKGAKLVVDAEGIINELGIMNHELRTSASAKASARQAKYQNLSKDEEKIVKALENEGLSFDEIVRKTGLKSSKTASILSMMEIKGIIKNSGGNYLMVTSDVRN